MTRRSYTHQPLDSESLDNFLKSTIHATDMTPNQILENCMEILTRTLAKKPRTLRTTI